MRERAVVNALRVFMRREGFDDGVGVEEVGEEGGGFTTAVFALMMRLLFVAVMEEGDMK